MFESDKGCKWLIQHHSDTILWLAGIRDLVEWKSPQAETVGPRRIPDGRKVPASELLEAGDVRLIPLLPLSKFDGAVDPILEECRKRIERDAPAGERDNLLVVTHFPTGLQYNAPRLFKKLGGKKAMLETGSPLLRELFEKSRARLVARANVRVSARLPKRISVRSSRLDRVPRPRP